MTRGQRSTAVRLHNNGRKIPAIADHIGVTAREVREYRKTRKGFPDKIECDRLRYPIHPRARTKDATQSSAARTKPAPAQVFGGNGMTTPKQILDGETKADAIRRLWKESELQPDDLAALVGCSRAYVYSTIWRMDKPGYAANWMRNKRETDPEYRNREREIQRANNGATRRYRTRRDLESRA